MHKLHEIVRIGQDGVLEKQLFLPTAVPVGHFFVLVVLFYSKGHLFLNLMIQIIRMEKRPFAGTVAHSCVRSVSVWAAFLLLGAISLQILHPFPLHRA